MAAHSQILAWSIPWTEELSGRQSMGRKESDTTASLCLQCLCGSQSAGDDPPSHLGKEATDTQQRNKTRTFIVYNR